MDAAPTTVRVLDTAGDLPEIPILEGDGNAKVVMWPGNGASFRSFNLISMKDGTSTIPLTHPSDCVWYVMEGGGAIVDLANGETVPLAEGTMLHIDAGDRYRIVAGAGGLRVLGGPCPADDALYAGLKRTGEAGGDPRISS